MDTLRNAKRVAPGGLLIRDEASARVHCLREGVDAPDLTFLKNFFRFLVATSRSKIVEIPTADSVNTFAEWLFASFHRITGTPIDEGHRREVYNVSSLPYGRDRSNLTITSGYEKRSLRRV